MMHLLLPELRRYLSQEREAIDRVSVFINQGAIVANIISFVALGSKLVESHFFPQLDGEKTFPTVSSFLLYGMAGSGKSQLAHSFFIKYAEKCVDLRFSQAVANVLEVQSHVLGQC